MKNANSQGGLLLTYLFFIAMQFTVHGQLSNKSYDVKEGKIIMILPELSSSVTISGTVYAEPSGTTEKEKHRNLQTLQSYHFQLGQQSIPVNSKKFTLVVPGEINALPLELINHTGESVSREEIPLIKKLSQLPSLVIPAYFLAGEPAKIVGQFDGNFSNTSLKINGNETDLMAECPGKLYFKSPTELKGNVNIECSENGKPSGGNSNALHLDMNADKLDLRNGEKTVLHVQVSGLEGLKETVPLVIENLSPSTINLEGGVLQTLSVSPDQAPGGSFRLTRSISSLRNGRFSVSANIKPPSTLTSPESTALLCNCFLDNGSHLLPPQTCQSLGGTCGNAMPGMPERNDTPAVNNQTPVTHLTTPALMDPANGGITLELQSLNDNVAAVYFSEKPVWSNEWRSVGEAVNNGNSWTYQWTAPLGNEGLHTIRAQVAGKDNSTRENKTTVYVSMSPITIEPKPTEGLILTISASRVLQAENNAKRTGGLINQSNEKIAELEKKQQDLRIQAEEKINQAEELVAIDRSLDQVPKIYRDSLKQLVDSLKKLTGGTPVPPNAPALKQHAEDAAQRWKDCMDRLAKLKAEKADLEKQRDDLKGKMDALLDKMDKLHHDNGWIGRHGYHPSGQFWYGYVGDEKSNTQISAEANNIGKQLRPLNKAYMNALKRLKALDNELKNAEDECAKLKKEMEDAQKAEANGNQAEAVTGQVEELNRQVQSLLDALRDWCSANPGLCKFSGDLEGLNKIPLTPEALENFLDNIDDVINKKKQLENELKRSAENDTRVADGLNTDIEKEKEKAKALEEEQARQQAEADQLRQEREKQLEAEREKKRKKEEEARTRETVPKPQPTLPEPVNPSDDQIKFQAQRMFRDLYQDFLIDKGPCDCRTKAIALANNTNTIVTDIIGRIGVGVAFAPLEALPGLSFGAKLGLGAAKALAGALYGGQSFTDELVKNLFSVIGGELFPHLTGDDFTGSKLSELASGGLDKLMEAEGIRSMSWEGETELRYCGKVKGKTISMFNPNTGWVVLMIKIDNCPPVIIKYKVNKDGVPVTKPVVQVVRG